MCCREKLKIRGGRPRRNNRHAIKCFLHRQRSLAVDPPQRVPAGCVNHALQTCGICRADQFDVDLIADLSRRELIDEGREATQWVDIKIYGGQPDYEDALDAFGKNVFGIVHRFTFFPRK